MIASASPVRGFRPPHPLLEAAVQAPELQIALKNSLFRECESPQGRERLIQATAIPDTQLSTIAIV